MALVTSKGTMDKENPAVRKYIAQRAELLGAIRLPNDTFKGNAGTEVVSDILILQKRDRIIDIEPDWVHLNTDKNGIRMNSYFAEHPEMILGDMKIVSGRFGDETTCTPYENADLESLLDEAVSNIHGEITEYETEENIKEEDNSIPADPNVRNFSYTVLDDVIYFRENSRMSPVEVSATAENRIKGLIEIRNSVRTLLDLQTEDYPDSDIKAEQERLNKLYDSFTKSTDLSTAVQILWRSRRTAPIRCYLHWRYSMTRATLNARRICFSSVQSSLIHLLLPLTQLPKLSPFLWVKRRVLIWDICVSFQARVSRRFLRN